MTKPSVGPLPARGVVNSWQIKSAAVALQQMILSID